MLTLNMFDFFHTLTFVHTLRTGSGAQTVLAHLLNLENLGSEQKGSVVAHDKYISPAGVLKERFHEPLTLRITAPISFF